jgi:hypothetical protein
MHRGIFTLFLSTRASVTEYEEVTQLSLDSFFHHDEDVVAQLNFEWILWTSVCMRNSINLTVSVKSFTLNRKIKCF